MHFRVAATLCVCVAILGTSACGPMPNGLDGAGHAVIGGTETLARPEVGRLIRAATSCTGTLLSETIVLTAAHCFNYGSGPYTEEIGTFMVQTGAYEAEWFRIEETKSLGSAPGLFDVALVRLGMPVGSEIATPVTIAPQPPSPGDALTLFGFGCTGRDARRELPTKRLSHVTYGDESGSVCKGDSGGPAFNDEGQIALVVSGYSTLTGRDAFAFPQLVRDGIAAQLAAWGGDHSVSTEPPEEAPPPDCLGGPSAEEATPLEGPTSGTVCSERDAWFTLAARGPTRIVIEFDHREGDIDAELFDESGTSVDRSQTTTDREELKSSTSSELRLRVYGYQGASAEASVTFESL